jgi:toxin ParE1/3/4
MKYKLTKEVEFDLINIHHFGVFRFGEKQADKYYYSFFEQFDAICKNPYQFPQVDHIRKGYRRCVCGVDSIYYRINNDTIEIIAIVGMQDVNNKL